MLTSIIAPVRGLCIATYACPVGELGDRFVGYFNLYAHRAVCFCEPGALHKGVTAGDFASAEEAQHQAVLAARELLDRLGLQGCTDRLQPSPAQGGHRCAVHLP